MGNLTNRTYLKKYLKHLGEEVEDIENIFNPSLQSEYKKMYSTYDNIHTASSEFFFNVFEKNYKEKPLDEFIYFTSKYCFDLILDKKTNNHSALKALGLIFKKYQNEIKPSHYTFMTDQYIKNINKSKEINFFFNFFDIEKFNKNYLALICISTNENNTLKKLSKNYQFNQSEYIYAILHQNDFVKSSFENSGKICVYDKNIENFFIFKLELGEITSLNENLIEYIHKSKDLSSLKEAILNQEKDRPLRIEGYTTMSNNSLIKSNTLEFLQLIEKYGLFLDMNENLENKPKTKTNKI